MASSDARQPLGSRILLRLGALALLLGASLPANAVDCSTFPNNTLDGATGAVPPSQIQIDGNCTIRNYPASNPLSTNFSFLTQPGQTDERWVIIFDNVVHTGQMACNAVAGHKIWFTNGSSSSIQQGCQNLLIPVEKIDKRNPVGQTTAVIGVPFTYTLTMPVLFDPATRVVINTLGSNNDLHGVTVIDDLNATGADLTYVSHVAYWQGSGLPAPHTFSNVGGVLTFDNFPIIPAGQQIVVELTVVLNDTPANVVGTQFVNTAKWDFGRLIDGVFYEPLPGEWGISQPLTIAGPQLTVTKTGPATMNLGVNGNFVIDVRNTGNGVAWDARILDRLPDGSSGGMCDATPVVQSARVFAADGVTPVPGKGPLTAGTDFTLGYTGTPTCELGLTMLTAAAAIAPGERLIIAYQTQLDADTQDGATLTNVAGATQWFNADVNAPDRQAYNRALTNGTVGTADHEDAHTVTVALSGTFFEKTVANLTTAVSPTAVASPGDRLRYSLRLRTTDTPVSNVRFFDDLGELNTDVVFVPGSLSLVAASVPAGADVSNTNPGGGTNGAGIVDVRNLSLPAASEVAVQFDVTLAPRIANGTYVTNQADLFGSSGAKLADSDDPNVNGLADPDVVGDEDPTRVLIQSAPAFDVDKISTYLDGDPTVLMAGERLRYTIRVQNVGTDDATDTVLRDQIPANTTYIAGSTRLNGVAVADGAGDTPPFINGMPINSPADSVPGGMSADATANNIAIIEFDVRVYPDVPDGTVISNQAFVSAVAGGVVDQPSDDPRTAIVDDPTRDVVGNAPILYAEKMAALQQDYGSPGIVDPGDVLRYTIRIYNNGAVDATNVTLTDGVPANTTYVADSMTLNGEPVGQPDGGVFPLAGGIAVSSADLTPPLPGLGEGTLSPGGVATVQFDLRVDDGVATGTLIVNQAVVTSEEAPNLLTDGDGNPATGPEPTVVVVGPAQQLAISKQVAVVGGGPALAGATLEYTVQVRNISVVPAVDVELRDDLDDPVAGQLTFVPGSETLNGQPQGVVINGSLLTVDYGVLAPGATFIVRFQATIDDALPMGTRVINRAVVYWNTTQQAEAIAAIDVGGIVGVGILSGSVWHDADFDNQLSSNERVLGGWSVTLYRDDQPVQSTVSAPDGTYQISGIAPNYQSGEALRLVFTAPGAGVNTALLGRAYSQTFTNGLQQISDIVVQPGSNFQNLDLPIDPNGVVYNAVTRVPVAGVTLTLLSAGVPLPASCFDDTAQQNQVTRADGYYKFDLNLSSPSCPSGGAYTIRIIEPLTGYTAGYSEIIPPTGDDTSPPFSVPGCPGTPDDAIVATPDYCELQVSEFAPGTGIPAQSPGTRYRVHQLLFDDSGVPGSAQLFNNHIPVDPILEGVVAITKTTPMVNVTRGQLVPYRITVSNTYPVALPSVAVVDRLPPGFRYIEGSARFDGVPLEPTVSNRELTWAALTLAPEGQHTIQLLLGVGAGVGEGEFVNRAQAMNELTGLALSEEATATVRVIADPTFDCTDVTGKVFDDANRNGVQDFGEEGLQGVRVVSAQGLVATTDAYGRYHITCAVTPRDDRGSNFMLKVDDRTLPSGFRVSSDRLQIKRATRGKALRFNFGASIHRVVGLELADGVFEPDTADLRPMWVPRFDLLLAELEKGPAVLRLTYLADLEEPHLVDRRLRTVKKEIVQRWKQRDCCYRLEVETDVFWRLGEPAKDAVKRAGERHD